MIIELQQLKVDRLGWNSTFRYN